MSVLTMAMFIPLLADNALSKGNSWQYTFDVHTTKTRKHGFLRKKKKSGRAD